MPSAKLTDLVSLAGAQVPTDLAYVVDVSAGVAGSKSSTLNDLFAIITKNVTDGAVRFQGFAAPAVSGAGAGAIYFDSTANAFLVSENTGAYRAIGDVFGPGSATDNAIARFDLGTGKLIQNSVVTIADVNGNMAGVGTLNTHTIPGGTDTFALLAATQAFTNKTITNSNNTLGGVAMVLGGDATGDTYFRNAGGLLTRLAIGSVNQVLTVSAGLPSWQNAVSVPGGLTTQVQFNNGGVFGGISGVTSDATNLIAGTGNLRATLPQITTGIRDANANLIIGLSPVASAVNQFTIANAATGNAPVFSVTGSDTNIPANIATKGTGDFVLLTNSVQRIVVAGADSNTYFGNGITNAAPANYVLNATGGSGTNIAGAHLDLAGGKGTGNATPGMVAVRYPLIGATGTTLQSLSTDRFPVSVSMYTITVPSVISNTAAETSIFVGNPTAPTPSAGSTRTIQAGAGRPGTFIRVVVNGAFTVTATPTLTLRYKLGGVTALTTVLSPTLASFLTTIFEINIETIGATGNISSTVQVQAAPTSTTVVGINNLLLSGTTTVDFTANADIDITAQWSAASASNSLTSFQISIFRDR